MYLSRVTWLVFGTALVLVAAVLAAAVLFINGGGQSFPSGGQSGSGAVVHVRTPEGARGGASPSGRARFAIARGGRRVAARPAAAGVTAALGTSPANGAPTPGTPPGDQYGGRLQQLKAALGH